MANSESSTHKSKISPVKINLYIFTSFFLITTGFILFINIEMPLAGEDYSLSPWGYNSSPALILEKIDLICHKVYLSATLWSPRVGEALSTITAAFPPLVFDVINTLVFIWLIIILFVLSRGRFPTLKKSQDVFTLFSTTFLIIALFPLLGQIFIWKSGTCNHIWGLVFLLSFSLPFRLSYNNHQFVLTKTKLLFFTLLGFLAGLSVENAAVVILGFLLIYYTILTIKKRIDINFVYPLISFAISLSFLLFSSATTIRRNYYQNLGVDENLSGLPLYFHRFLKISYDFIRISWPLLLIFIVCLIAYFIFIRPNAAIFSNTKENSWSKKLTIYELLIILFTSSLSIPLLISIAYQSDQRRGFALFWLILISITAFMMTEIWIRLRSSIARSIPIIVILGWLIPQMVIMGTTYSTFNFENNQRMEIIYSALENGDSQVTLPAIRIEDSRIIDTREILPDLGKRIAEYYGFESVTIGR